MPVESATYVNQLDQTNPPSTDPTGQGDDHLRLIKSALKASFPNVGGAATITDVQLSTLATALAAKQSMVPTGAMLPFANTFSDASWLRCNGGTFNYVDHPELGAFLGYVSGVCTLPNLEDTGRYVRSVTSGLAVRTTQSNQNKSHTHTGSVSSSGSISGTAASAGSHSHTITSTATVNDPGHGHDLVFNGVQASSQSIAVSVPSTIPIGGGGAASSTNHSLSVAGNGTGITVDVASSGASAGAHTHTVSGTASVSGSFTTAADGGTEARPESYAAVWYIHV